MRGPGHTVFSKVRALSFGIQFLKTAAVSSFEVYLHGSYPLCAALGTPTNSVVQVCKQLYREFLVVPGATNPQYVPVVCVAGNFRVVYFLMKTTKPLQEGGNAHLTTAWPTLQRSGPCDPGAYRTSVLHVRERKAIPHSVVRTFDVYSVLGSYGLRKAGVPERFSCNVPPPRAAHGERHAATLL